MCNTQTYDETASEASSSSSSAAVVVVAAAATVGCDATVPFVAAAADLSWSSIP